MFGDLIRDARFWTAVVVLIKAVLFYALPGFPKEIWGAFDALLAVVIGTMAGQSIAVQRRAAGERGVLAGDRYQVDAQDVAVLVGLVLLSLGLALFDFRWALLGVGGLLLLFAVVGALRARAD